MQNTSKITSKGQVVIPAWIRKKLGLKAGMQVVFSEEKKDIVIHPVTPDYFKQFAGMWGKDSKALDILIAERKKDKEREDAKLQKYLRS